MDARRQGTGAAETPPASSVRFGDSESPTLSRWALTLLMSAADPAVEREDRGGRRTVQQSNTAHCGERRKA